VTLWKGVYEMSRKQKILVLAQEQETRTILLRLVAESGIAEADFEGPPGVILFACGARIPKGELKTAQRIANGKIPIILITSCGSEELAIEALRCGFSNYLRLPLTAADLSEALRNALPLPEEPFDGAMEQMIGNSQIIRNLKSYLLKAASCSSNVLITGETGCGKEITAELIHRYSPRRDKPFVAINCAAIPDSLFESELFGFERGSFTGAQAAQDGKLKLADGGTVFLDEIGDLSSYAQAKLLRAIESGEIQRLGGRKPQVIDIRVVAATNRELEHDPNFRKDLFFRLNVARIHLPPLRDRKEDIFNLAESFRAEFDRKFGRRTTGFTSQARELMMTHDWPGNVRELRNVIEAAFIDLAWNALEIELPPPFRKALETAAGVGSGERERILLALSETQWNKSRAAERLHWSRMTLYRKLAQHKISKASSPSHS
jgi:DNA-binding NtrC family response regulator